MAGPDFSLELEAHRRGVADVAGVDEAGRGPLAGPVVAAAVILDHGRIPAGIDDSKVLSHVRREALYEALKEVALIGVAMASPARIDAMNIRAASLWAMSEALKALPQAPGFALVDGRDRPPGAPCRCEALVKGDGRSLSIAAASIVAKVLRDRIMVALDGRHPGYGFAAHKGYPTTDHRAALVRLGPTPHHRRTYAPVRAALEGRA